VVVGLGDGADPVPAADKGWARGGASSGAGAG
jgi:hypothetical protein